MSAPSASSPALPRIDEELVRTLPKAEVHVHLEGGIALADLLHLAKENGETLPGPAATLFDVSTHHEFAMPEETTGGGAGVGTGGLSGFLRFLDWQCGLVRTPEQAARIAYVFAARQSVSGTRYTDVIINPTHWSRWRGRETALLDAVSSGFEEAEQDGLCSVNIAWSLLRTQSADEAREIVEHLVDHRPSRVVALSVDGDEKVAGRTGPKFTEAFRLAKAAGLRRTVHAGESSGPEGVWDALDLLHAERIDHGVRAIEDPRLVERLAADGIPLGICPRSNLTLGVYSGWDTHPIQALLDAGVKVTLNTDDPEPLGTTLVHDWAAAAQAYGWGAEDMVGFAARSIDASFADDDLKASLHGELDSTAAALR
ncbi:adenosine deaminase [Demequina zhanjiangensis]|uniref:Adenosine deaminase n=1 Tax=Demequina zhanjiangensis TaxID=3051659 RepID=A0ABT8G3D8_9MICO|nr:adenosine deaminase [Demequina sp. SYSU T00b26]MDN4473527.1 adenosine deaminase [Demequina sp. SYSU T00b26]